MKNSFILMITVAIIFSAIAPIAGAVLVKPEKLSQSEAVTLASAQADSADIMETTVCGGDSTDAALAAVGIFFIVLILAAAAAT